LRWPGDRWSFEHHPNCRRFETLEQAVTCIMAMQAGEAGRERSTLRRVVIA